MKSLQCTRANGKVSRGVQRRQRQETIRNGHVIQTASVWSSKRAYTGVNEWRGFIRNKQRCCASGTGVMAPNVDLKDVGSLALVLLASTVS